MNILSIIIITVPPDEFTIFNHFADRSFFDSTRQAKWFIFMNLLKNAQNFRDDIVFFDSFTRLCGEKDISASRCAMEAGISKSLVTKWKRNQTAVPSSEVLTKLSDYFHIPVSELLGESHTAMQHTSLPTINRDDLKFALFHGQETVTDAMLDEVLSFARYVAHREESQKK